MVRLVSWVRFPQRARPTRSAALARRVRSVEGQPWRRSSVGQSIRLIIGRSSVRSRSPLRSTYTSITSTSAPENTDHHEQGEVRAYEAPCEYWDDGSY